MASLLTFLRPDSVNIPLQAESSDGPRKRRRKRIPKVAVYVSGAAFAVTIGLTALVFPHARAAAKMMAPRTPPLDFLSTHHLARSPQALPPRSSIPHSTAPDLDWARTFNAREERILSGAPVSTPNPTKDDGDDDGDGEGPLLEPPDPLMGIKALGIATGLVGGCAGLGVLVVAWVLGVRDMTEFSAKMRESVQVGMPVLSSSVNRPAVEGPGDVEGGADIVGGTLDGWFAALEQEEEDEEW